MNHRLVPILLLVIGFSLGWLSCGGWEVDDRSERLSQDVSHLPSLTDHSRSTDSQKDGDTSGSSAVSTALLAIESKQVPTLESNQSVSPHGGLSVVRVFEQLLKDQQYQDATALYQEQDQRNTSSVSRLRALLLRQLDQLLTAREYTRFSELVDAFLSVYHDDIDVLLLLADFNYRNSFFIEAVNVYQFIKTYAYTAIQQQQGASRFDEFVSDVDQYYTKQKDWFSLSGFYSHIEVSGLLSASYQYRQAIAYLNSGDEFSAIERLKPLVNDREVGNKAVSVLNTLIEPNIGAGSSQDNRFQGGEKIALQQLGNQYLVDLQINRRDKVTLLIDTGASMTTLSRSAFSSLSTRTKAVAVGTRIFQTANGITKGTVYAVDQLRLGSFQLNNTHIAVLDFSLSPGVDGLLGMNVLGQFHFQIDQDNVSLLVNLK